MNWVFSMWLASYLGSQPTTQVENAAAQENNASGQRPFYAVTWTKNVKSGTSQNHVSYIRKVSWTWHVKGVYVLWKFSTPPSHCTMPSIVLFPVNSALQSWPFLRTMPWKGIAVLKCVLPFCCANHLAKCVASLHCTWMGGWVAMLVPHLG